MIPSFERFVDMELRVDERDIRDTIRSVSKTECEDLCLKDNGCLSASYDYVLEECLLSSQNRYTRPDAFMPRQGVDYLENQCKSGM